MTLIKKNSSCKGFITTSVLDTNMKMKKPWGIKLGAIKPNDKNLSTEKNIKIATSWGKLEAVN